MNKTNLVIALNSLSKEEWLGFRKNLLGLTKTSTELFRLFSYFQKHKLALSKLPSLEDLRAKHFRELSSKGLSNLMSRLFQILEQWLIIQEMEKSTYQKQLFLLSTYNNRGLYKLANGVARKLETQIQSGDVSLRAEHLAKLHHAQYYSNNPIKSSKNNSLYPDLINNYLTHTSEYALLYLMEIENRTIKGLHYNERDKKQLEALIFSSENNGLSEMLKIALAVLKKYNREKVASLKDYLESNILDSSSNLFLILVTYLERSLVEAYHKSLVKDHTIFVDVQQLKFSAIDSNEHLKLLPVHIFNATVNVSMATSYEQTESFISRWIDKVHSSFPESTAAYCTAINEFRHDRFESLPRILTGLKFDNLMYKLESVAMLIIAQYKLDEDLLVSTLIQNFRKQFQRNKKLVSKRNFTGLNNLIEIIQLLQKSKYDKSINIDLESYESIYFRNWVVKELE